MRGLLSDFEHSPSPRHSRRTHLSRVSWAFFDTREQAIEPFKHGGQTNSVSAEAYRAAHELCHWLMLQTGVVSLWVGCSRLVFTVLHFDVGLHWLVLHCSRQTTTPHGACFFFTVASISSGTSGWKLAF